MKILTINNLKSGFQDGAIYDFLRCVCSSNDEAVIRSFDDYYKLKNLLVDADLFDCVVAAGGDATVSAVSYGLANSCIPILAFPAGSANMIAQNLLLPNEPHALAKVVLEGNTLDFDCGQVVSSKKLNSGSDSYGFGVMASIGFTNNVIKNAKSTKLQFGPLSYAAAAISNSKPDYYKFELTLDGETVNTSGIGIMIMNFSKIGLDLSVTHTNLPRDGKLDVVVLKAKSRRAYLPAITAAAIDNAIDFPDRSDALEIYSASEVIVDSDKNCEVYVDELATDVFTPFCARCKPFAVKFFINEEGEKFYK